MQAFFVALLVPCLMGAKFAKQPDNGLVGWWAGNGNAIDTVGEHNGVLHDGVKFGPGMVGQAFYFDGNRSAIFVSDAEPFKLTQSLTIKAWVKVTDFPTPGQIGGQILFRGDNHYGMDPYTLGVDFRRDLLFHIDSGQGVVELFAPISIGQVHFVAGTLDDATGLMRLYMDGRIVGTTRTSVRPLRDLLPDQNPGIGIGNTQDPGFSNQPFNGILGDLKLYSTANPPVFPVRLHIEGDKAGGDQASVGMVTLNDSPLTDVTVPLRSSDPSVTVPVSVTVPAGLYSATFPITHNGAISSTATITAGLNGTSAVASLGLPQDKQ